VDYEQTVANTGVKFLFLLSTDAKVLENIQIK
jgi:hypothetical protein